MDKIERKRRRLSVRLRWVLEEYTFISEKFEKVYSQEDFSTVLEPSGDKFFYRVAFICGEGCDNDQLSEEVYSYLLENLEDEVLESLAGISVNFLWKVYGEEEDVRE